MTVMPSSSDVADKAVSTEDAASGVEVVRLEAVLAALVETKVEAMKASSTTARRSGSAPPSPRRPRLTSSSTASSSQNHHHHHHHHPHYHHQHRQHEQLPHVEHHQHEKKKREDRRRRHDSAPCGEYIEDPTVHNHHKQRPGKGRRRASENPRSPRKRRRHSKSPQVVQRVVQDFHGGLETGLDLSGIDGDQELALINFERAREGLSDSCEYPKLHRSACCFSQSAAQLKIHYDEDDYIALNLDDEFEEEESLPGPEKGGSTVERYHRPRRKRKRRRVEPESVEEELGDPEELPPRARWTIVATACLLLAMSLLLVGVTLRMAPIIDDMVPKIPETKCIMDLDRNRQLLGQHEERIIFYVDDMSTENQRESSPEFLQPHIYHGLYPPSPDVGPQRSNSVCSQSGRPRRNRHSLEVDPPGRRCSVASQRTSRSRVNSFSRPTPLGDGRRASVCRKGKPRRASTARRKDSVRPTKAIVLKELPQLGKSPAEIEQARRHRRIAIIILATFVFLLVASVLVVVITLTHSSFHSPATGSKELTEHRAQLRKENEELLNSLNRDSSVPVNTTVPP